MFAPGRARSDRVVVTGIGLRTGLGPDAESTWNGLRAGRSAVGLIGRPLGTDRSWYGFPIRAAGDDPGSPGVREAEAALRDAGLLVDGRMDLDRDRIATVVGLSKGDLGTLVDIHREVGGGRLDPRDGCGGDWTASWPDGAGRAIAGTLGLHGPRLAPIAACATGVVALLRAVELIRTGACDLALAGAVDRSLHPLVLGAFDRMGALARAGEEPEGAVRPLDRSRSGFLVGEGGAVLVLEREGYARARGALPYAEVLGGAMGSDAYHVTNLSSDPGRLASLIVEAMRRSGVDGEEVDYVNLHGTATRVNDPLECRSIRAALGPHADSVSCSANKAQIGHLLGGAGAAELAITCLAIRDQFVPPTLNLTDPDPECDLDGTPIVGRSRRIRAALKLSLGFGGHLAVALLRRPDGACRSR